MVNVIYTHIRVFSYVSRQYDVRVYIEVRDDSSHLSGFHDISVITLFYFFIFRYIVHTRIRIRIQVLVPGKMRLTLPRAMHERFRKVFGLYLLPTDDIWLRGISFEIQS